VTVGVLLLAAGESRRFGSDKRRARLPHGPRLLTVVVDTVRRTGLPLRVCLRPGEASLAEESGLESGEVLVCTQAAGGMGHTLAEGVAQLPSWAGVLVALADMPGIRVDTFCQAAAALTPERIVVPEFRGRPGHPVGFGRDWFPRLRQSTGDAGARALVQEAGGLCDRLAVTDAGILRDIDYPDDLGGWSTGPA